MILLVVILFITGSYIRNRPVDESDTADWLVIVELGLCAAAGLVGGLLVHQYSLGKGARLLLAFLMAALTSSIFSSYPSFVIGYWILLAGTGVLCIGLVSSSPTVASLRRLERLILITLSLMVVKDTIIDFFFLEYDENQELYRAGDTATSANLLGLTAALAFCMSLEHAGSKSTRETQLNRNTAQRILWLAIRAFVFAVILLTRSRVALIGSVVGCAVRLWFRKRQSPGIRSHLLFALIPCCAGIFFALASLGWIMEMPAMTGLVDFVNRGADMDELMSVTGRTEVWPYAIQRIFEGKTALIFGHGYAASRKVLNENNWRATFFAQHSHNTFLEVLLSTGLLGATTLLLLMSYSLKWLLRFSDMCRSFSLRFTLGAVATLTAILSSTMTESDVVTKVGPAMIVFFFYALVPDLQALFTRENRSPANAE